jgi:GntR family transcriptional regulator
MDGELPGPFRTLKVSRRSSTPAYLQIAESLSGILKGDALPPGYPLPPERMLCEQFGVSRMTLRQAIGILEREGLILSHRGRGTCVAHNLLRRRQQEMRSFSEEILARGGKPESRLLSFGRVASSREGQEFFGLAAGEEVYEIRRTRLTDKVPLALETVCLSERLCPRLEQYDLVKNSLYGILEESYGLRLDNCVEEVSAQQPTPEQRRLLEVPRNVALLAINRKSFTDLGQPLELAHSVYRGDLYSAIVHSVRRRPIGEK